MKKIILLIIFLPVLITANKIKERTEAILKSEFGANVVITFTKFKIPEKVKNEIEIAAKQRFFSESVLVWNVFDNDSLLAIAIMDNVYGKAQPITFLTIFTLEGTIHSNYVVKYREEHGGQVVQKAWNKQFIGMDKNADVNKAVDGISGATISVNSIKKGVIKLIMLFDTIFKKNKY